MSSLINLSGSEVIDRSYDESKINMFFDNPVTMKWIDACTTQFKDMWVVRRIDGDHDKMITVVACPIEATVECNGNLWNYGHELIKNNPGVYGLTNLILPD